MTETLLDKKSEVEQKATPPDEGSINVDRPRPFVVACIPAYREENHIAKVLLETWRSVNEVIVCDDGSDDSTAEIARVFGATVLKHEHNDGYEVSLKSLFKEANRIGADIAVTLDSNGQDDPRDIPILLDRIRKGDADIVIGSHFLGSGDVEVPRRSARAEALNAISQSVYHLSDIRSGFRAYTRKAIKSLTLIKNEMRLSTDILVKAREMGLKIAEVPLNVVPSGDASSQTAQKVEKLIVACIPAYNEERSIGSVILDLREYVDDIFVCDDGSSDHTRALAEAMGAIVVSHENNMGKGEAMRTLMKSAQKFKPDAVVFIDADGQHDPSYIPKLVEPILSGESDFVIGSRFIEKSVSDVPFYRRVGLWVLDRTTSGKIKDTQSGYRAFSPKVLDHLLESEANGFGIESEEISLANKNGFRIKEVPIAIKYNGVSKSSKKNPLSHGVDIASTLVRLVAEERPMLFLGIPALLVFLMGVIAGLYLLVGYNNTAYFSIPFALISIAGISLGTFMATATLILYAISTLKKRTRL